MNQERSWYKNRMVAVLAMMCGTVGLAPLVASAHHITETPKASCADQNVTVTVAAWAGNVEITRTSPLPVKVTEVTPTLDSNGNGSAVVLISLIGGNGDYTAGREGFPNDPTPVAFTVNCPMQPAIATTKSAGGAVGTVIHDLATVTGGNSPTGDVTFNLYAPSQATCQGTPVFTDPKAPISGTGTATSGDYTTVAVGIYRWTATYNGDANNLSATSGCDAEQVTITKAEPRITTTPHGAGVVGTMIHDVATVTGGNNPTGDVTFSLYDPSQAACGTAVWSVTKPLQNGEAHSGTYTTLMPGTYRWIAKYNGDSNNSTATSGCSEEQVVITKDQPIIATTPSAGGAIGIVIHDVANVTGGHSPTGDVTFRLYGPSQVTCEGAAVFTDTQGLGGGQATSGNYTTAAVGTYHWTATYKGDANNMGATSGCEAELVTITQDQPSIATTKSDGGTVGTVIRDVATVSGGHSPAGTVTFRLYDPTEATCDGSPIFTDVKTLANGQATSGDYTTAAVGTYRWTATYAGDANNLGATSGCQDEQVTVTSPPTGVEAASVSLPNTGHYNIIQSLLVALLMVLLGTAFLLGQAFYRPVVKRDNVQ